MASCSRTCKNKEPDSFVCRQDTKEDGEETAANTKCIGSTASVWELESLPFHMLLCLFIKWFELVCRGSIYTHANGQHRSANKQVGEVNL